METISTISKSPPEDPSMDFDFLLAEGVRQLEELATQIWTDFNAHDPGITILEVLCYALTDLSYRTNLPIQDLLASGKTNEQPYFSAPEILSNEPVSILDYRKLLIDIPGVKNAWLDKYQPDSTRPISEFEYGRLFSKLQFRPEVVKILIEQLLDKHASIPPQLANVLNTFSQTPAINNFRRIGLILDRLHTNGRISPDLLRDLHDLLKDIGCEGSFVEVQLTGTDPGFDSFALNGLYCVYLELDHEIDSSETKLVESIRQAVSRHLHDHRGLAEDFVEIKIVESIEWCVCLNLEVSPQLDEQEVVAAVFDQLQEYLSPSIPIHSLRSLLEQGYACDDIYDGPLLTQGFLLDEEVEQAILPDRVYRSDLLGRIMGVEGVVKINEFAIQREAGHPRHGEYSTAWCEEVFVGEEARKKVVLNPCCSTIHVQKGQFRQTLKGEELEKHLNAFQLARTWIPDTSLTSPYQSDGIPREDLANYLSTQIEFPRTYGIGEHGLGGNATSLRKAQSRQTQAFLLFFDQILAAYLAQLAQVRELLSVHQAAETPTYFFQALYEVPGMQELIKDFQAKLEEEEIDDPDQIELSWEEYQENDNAYITQLRSIIEGEDAQKVRKNRILDHLLARFGEQFSEYVLHLFQPGVAPEEDPFLQPYGQYVQNKASFLHQLPVLGSQRGKAYNIHAQDLNGGPDIWNTENVSGLKKRAYALLGLGIARQESLLCEPEFIIEIDLEESRDGIPRYRLMLKEKESGKLLLSSPKRNRRQKVMLNRREEAYHITAVEDAYRVFEDQKQEGFRVGLYGDYEAQEPHSLLLQSELMPEGQAHTLKSKLLHLAMPEGCEEEGFHLVEHILLRPEDPSHPSLNYSLSCDPECPVEDPYSFWISVILPGQSERLANSDFRAYVESSMRREAPAHIGLRFCWLAPKELTVFEAVFRRWRLELARPKRELAAYGSALSALIDCMNLLPCTCHCSHDVDPAPLCVEPSQSSIE
ncbi:MAG: hypothetical protein AAF587_15000 [Bacteroidota bacterium]